MTLIESEQTRDTHLTQIFRGPFVFRFASYIKSEDAKLGLRSEDYIVGELTTEKSVFGLCDGVGASYYGNIGSQFLGEIILNWFGNVSVPKYSSLTQTDIDAWLEKLNVDFKNELDNQIKNASNLIQNRESTSNSDLIRLAEKTQKDDFGTQSNFAGGIIWPKSNDLPNGLILLFWLGNARVRIFKEITENNFEELTHLTEWGSNPEQLKEVWSSKEGVVGHIYSYLSDFSKITSIIAYSDGLEGAEDGIKPNIQGVDLETLVHRAQKVKDDDVSYLEIFLSKNDNFNYADDIVGSFRHIHSVDANPKVAEIKDKLQELSKKYDNLAKAKENQVASFKKTKISFFFLTALLVLLSISIGLLLGYAIEKPEKNNTNSNNNIPTIVVTTLVPIMQPTETLLPTPPIEQIPVASPVPVESTPIQLTMTPTVPITNTTSP